MKAHRTFLIVLAALFAVSGLSLWAEDWKTIDGKVYQNVTVLHVEPDAVTILHKDGGALVPLELLPDDLQKRFHYDPAKAKAAADQRMQQEIADARALRAEREQLANQRRTEDEETARAADSSVGNNPGAASAPVAASSSTHHSMDELVNSTGSLRRDLSDPDYHTMAHLAASVHSLQADPNDPNHHSISDATNPGQ
jgi:hypothetical protein